LSNEVKVQQKELGKFDAKLNENSQKVGVVEDEMNTLYEESSKQTERILNLTKNLSQQRETLGIVGGQASGQINQFTQIVNSKLDEAT